MHTIGAKSGEERLAPVMGLRLDDGWLIVASKGGAPENPAWYYNLLAHPEFDVEVHVDGEIATVPVTRASSTGARARRGLAAHRRPPARTSPTTRTKTERILRFSSADAAV